MKAIVVRRWEIPPAFEYSDFEKPVAGAGQVVMAVDTAAVNFGDNLISSGTYQVQPTLPFVAGAEGAGVIVEVGPGVDPARIGQRVAAVGFTGDPRKDRRIIGAMAEYALVTDSNAVQVPDTVSLEDASLLRSNYETAEYALRRGQVKPDETLLVLGAAGGIGIATIQLGKLAGARVIASASTPEKRALALEAGADEAVANDDPDWRAKVEAFAKGDGIDVICDPVGGSFTERAFRTIGWRGRHLIVGFAAGEIPEIKANLPLLKEASVVGVYLLQGQKHEPEACRAASARLMKLLGEGRLKMPPVVRRYELKDAAKAYADVFSGKIVGRVVVSVHAPETR